MEAKVAPTTILTVGLDPQAIFEELRQKHYPRELNQVPAHLTLFHKLPPVNEINRAIHRAAHRPAFSIRVTGLRSLGRGVAFTLASESLMALHADLAETFAAHLNPQDRQPFQPHIVIQNKATPEVARVLLADLQATFKPFEATANALLIWDYLSGPWRQSGCFPFRED